MIITEEVNPLIVVDNFLLDVDQWRKDILNEPLSKWNSHEDLGLVIKPEFINSNLIFFEEVFSKLLNTKCSAVSFFCSRLEGDQDILTVTGSLLECHYVGVLYLHPSPPQDTGTVLFKHRSGLNLVTYNEVISSLFDALSIGDWIIDKTISNCYNRLVLFPGGSIARILSGFGEDYTRGGLIQLFNITRMHKERTSL